jgi:hypothetical protein
MDLQTFIRTHLPALERDEVRFGVLIGALAAAAANPAPALAFWTLGAPGHCAVRGPNRSIVLGDLDAAECRRLAHEAIAVAPAGALGDGDRPHCFADEAAALGIRLGAPIPQRIHLLRQPPRHPHAAGAARPATAEDAPLLYAWLSAFQREATPQAPPATQAEADKAARSGRFLLWTVDSRPVAMAAINRDLRQTGSIGAVYTPPEHRGAAMRERSRPPSPIASSLVARPASASTPTCATRCPTAAMPGSASSPTATPPTIRQPPSSPCGACNLELCSLQAATRRRNAGSPASRVEAGPAGGGVAGGVVL